MQENKTLLKPTVKQKTCSEELRTSLGVQELSSPPCSVYFQAQDLFSFSIILSHLQ